MQLDIDLETRSSVDIGKSGVYKYSESLDFSILLLSYAWNQGEVQTIDLAQGEEVPEEIREALTNPKIIKTAHNASFERVCLSRFLRDEGKLEGYIPPEGWHCTRVWCAYLGLPNSLKDAGAALKLDEQKMTEGKELIKLFCTPQKDGTWAQPAGEKWKTFKKYNKRDVEVEIQIEKKLEPFPVPESVWREYWIDQEINDRGVLVDKILAENAIRMDERIKKELTEKLTELTMLDNPNSVAQMKEWLKKNGLEMDSLGKKLVAEEIKTAPEPLKTVLKLRQDAARSSTKKYEAMIAAAGKDDRARGMFQFYGGHTGRWCLTGDHEVLTDKGWKRLDEWQGGKIACWNMSTERITFQKSDAVSFDYSGPILSYSDYRIDQCSTPDHKMAVKRRYSDEWECMTVEESRKHMIRIPLTGYKIQGASSNQTWLRVLIMTQADGSYNENGDISFAFKKKRKIERCKRLLRQAEIPFICHTCDLTVPSRFVPLWLREFREKTFGWWLLDGNPDVFFDELVYWDGYRGGPNSIQYSTVNKQNADVVQALAHLSGKTAIMLKKNDRNPRWHPVYVVNIWLKPSYGGYQIESKPKEEQYEGKVYCASTPTGFFLVRRNGKAWITGNSSKMVQLQNLPQNHLSTLDSARGLVKNGKYEELKEKYSSVPQTLSELIRTAFIPSSGNKFVVADFSAIEARVLSWLAGEEWRMKAFAAGEDIYCATASKMFGVKVVKNGENGELRQKGKQAELACIAEGQLVLTDHGEKPIEEVKIDDKLWDGETWVSHQGVICKGEKEVMEYEGLVATPDHLVFICGKKDPVPLMEAAANGAHLVQSVPQSNKTAKVKTCRVYDIRNAGPNHRFTVSGKLVHNCGYGGSVGAMVNMGALDAGLKEEELQDLVDAWRSASPKIVELWKNIEKTVMSVILTGEEKEIRGLKITKERGILFIALPSGRRLAYISPRIGQNRFGSPSITYLGVNGTTKKWERIETFGGKITENCLSGDTLVLTKSGLKKIKDIEKEDLIWDGVEWVSHQGVINQGVKEVISVDGLRMTPNHKILTEKGWIPCGESGGLNWEDVRLPDGYKQGAKQFSGSSMALQMQMRERKNNSCRGFKEEQVVRLHDKRSDKRGQVEPWNDESPCVWSLAFYEAALPGSESSCIQELWWTRDNCVQGVGGEFRQLLEGYGPDVPTWSRVGQARQQQGVLQRKLQVGYKENQRPKQENEQNNRYSLRKDECGCIGRANGIRSNNDSLQNRSRVANRISVLETGFAEPVYDIRNCGPRHRFVVYDPSTGAFRIVSNCVQAIARDVLCFAMENLREKNIVMHIHDELVMDVPADEDEEKLCEIMGRTPPWAPGLILRADGGSLPYYQK